MNRTLSIALLAVAAAAAPAHAADLPGRLALQTDWRLQSSAKVQAKGEAVSAAGFDAKDWYAASVPTTVFAALVANKVYPDPYFGKNLRQVPGVTYPIGQNFSNLEMPADSPFAVSWWYRTEFDVPAAWAGRGVALRFDGINYRANVWLNGRKVADAAEVVGAYRRFTLYVGSHVKAGARNALAVEVFAPRARDLAITWVDWNPSPPDKDMGLWGAVSLTSSGPLALEHPQVVSTLDLPSLDAAHLTVSAEVVNTTTAAVSGTVRGTIEAIRFEQPVALAAHEHKVVRFTPQSTPGLDVAKPRLWWPYRMGPQNLYTLTLAAEVDGKTSDERQVRFGIQQITSELVESGGRQFKVNGKPILIRGGGWASDMMLRRDPKRLEAELRYVKEMGLNTIRLEGKLEPEDFFDLADREGILVMAGWCCCDHWEKWDHWKPEDRPVAAASLRDQVRRLRNHPSVLVWLYGSDFPPPPDVEKIYLDVLAKEMWPKPAISSATAKPTPAGQTGVKMSGPYDYVPPPYWLDARSPGGLSGFNSETSPGPAVPPVESLKEFLPADHLWPIDDVWKYHAGGDQFKDLNLFTAALEARYGKATGVEDYARKSQALAYEGQRAMFEAFGRNKYKTTGVIQWMLNNAWPSLIWHLYDYYLRPGGGYFGSKKACEPLHVQYSYDDRSVVVVNDVPEARDGNKVTATVYDLGLGKKFEKEATVSVPADGVVRAFVVPELPGLTTTYFVALTLDDPSGKRVSSNFYWLSTRADVLDWKKSEWFTTPTTVHADLTALAQLPATTLDATLALETVAAGDARARVHVGNTGRALAFQVHLKLTDGKGGREILPVYWEDNYLALLPGEAREITVAYPAGASASPALEVEAWNVPASR